MARAGCGGNWVEWGEEYRTNESGKEKKSVGELILMGFFLLKCSLISFCCCCKQLVPVLRDLREISDELDDDVKVKSVCAFYLNILTVCLSA